MSGHRVFCVFAAVGALACAPRVPVPTSGLHRADTHVIVPYPPPPGQVEMLPPKPKEDAVWVDGCWTWRLKHYVWLPGGWERLPHPQAYYAPATTVRRSNGELFYYVGAWHLPSGAVIPKTGSE